MRAGNDLPEVTRAKLERLAPQRIVSASSWTRPAPSGTWSDPGMKGEFLVVRT